MTLPTVALAQAYDPASWRTFFTLAGTAAATLTGLFFLAFSLRLQELQQSVLLRARARYLLTWLVMIAIGSALVLIPGQSRAVLAAEILVLSAGCVALHQLVPDQDDTAGATSVLAGPDRPVVGHGGNMAAQHWVRNQPAGRARWRAVLPGVRGPARHRPGGRSRLEPRRVGRAHDRHAAYRTGG